MCSIKNVFFVFFRSSERGGGVGCLMSDTTNTKWRDDTYYYYKTYTDVYLSHITLLGARGGVWA